MAQNPASVYYSPSATGDATVLGSGLNPLNVYRQEHYRQQQERARAAKAQADLEKQFTPPTPNMAGGQLFADQVAKSGQDLLTYGKDQYVQAATGKITANEAKANVAARNAEHEGFVRHTAEVQKSLDDFTGNADKNFLDPAKAASAAYALAHDPATGEVIDLRKTRFNPADLSALTTNGELINRHARINKFIADLATKQDSEYAKAATPGQKGHDQSFSSNIFESKNGKAVMEIGPDGNPRPKIANMQLLEQEVLRDPQMAAIYRTELQKGQVPAAEALMRVATGTMSDAQSDAQLEALNNQTNTGTKQSINTLDSLLRDYGTENTKYKETSPMSVPRTPAGAAKGLKAGQASFTPTSSYGLSVSDKPTDVTKAVPNTARGGLFNFLNPTVGQKSQDPNPTKYNFPRVGTDFATESHPYLKVKVNTRDLSVLGKGGEATRYNKNDVNSLVDGNATGRHFVLELGGKRYGLPSAEADGRTSADAFEDMKSAINRLSPADARKAILKSYYEIGVSGKGATSGDGTGARAKIIGYTGADGNYLDSDGVTQARARGELVKPVYDKEEEQDVTLAPATAGLDAQIARQTPGWDARKRTPQEAEIIRLLEAKGGKVVDPYHTTQSSSAGSLYTPKSKSTPAPAKSGTAGLY